MLALPATMTTSDLWRILVINVERTRPPFTGSLNDSSAFLPRQSPMASADPRHCNGFNPFLVRDLAHPGHHRFEVGVGRSRAPVVFLGRQVKYPGPILILPQKNVPGVEFARRRFTAASIFFVHRGVA